MDFSQSTDDVTCSTNRELMPLGVPCGSAVTLEMTGTAGAAMIIFASSACSFGLRAGHERRVIRAGDGQRDCPFGAFGFGEFDGLGNFVRFAGNDELAGTVQVRQHHAGFGADFARRALRPAR